MADSLLPLSSSRRSSGSLSNSVTLTSMRSLLDRTKTLSDEGNPVGVSWKPLPEQSAFGSGDLEQEQTIGTHDGDEAKSSPATITSGSRRTVTIFILTCKLTVAFS